MENEWKWPSWKTILSDRHIFCVCIASDETRRYSWLISTRNHPRGQCLQIGCPQKVNKISTRSKLECIGSIDAFFGDLKECTMYQRRERIFKNIPKQLPTNHQVLFVSRFSNLKVRRGISSFYHLKWPSHNEIPFSGQSRLHCLGRIPSKLMVNNHILASWIPSFLLIFPNKFAINIMIDKNYYTYPCQQ